MNIAIVSRSNIEDRTYWSGVIEKVYYSLKLVKGIKVIKIDKLNNSIRKIYSLKREFLKYTKKEKYDDAYNKFVSKNFANQIKRKIEQNNIDYILCFDSSLIAHLDTKIPIILWTDLLYQDYYEHYFHNQNISINTLKSIRKIENLSIRKCHKILLPTKWAIKNAKIRHKSHSKKFYLLPFGINLKTSINKSNIKQIIKKKQKKKLILVTLSVDWKRKGVDKIIELKKILEFKGLIVKLIIIGAKNFKKYEHKNIDVVPFINKNFKGADNKISNLLTKSHFNLLFSSAEAYGIALLEANSRALPNLAFKVGGINNIVKNGFNGRLFNKNEKLDKIAEYVFKIFNNKKKYHKLSVNSYNYYNKIYSDKIIYNSFLKIIAK